MQRLPGRHLLMAALGCLLGCFSGCTGTGDEPADAGVDGSPGSDAALPGPGDAGLADAGIPPVVGAIEVYPPDRTLSPITPRVAEHLRTIASHGPDLADDVFAKIGDAATVSSSFLHCLAGGYVDPGPGQEAGDIDLDGRSELVSTIEHFAAGNAGGFDPYRRASLAASVGWGTAEILAGEPAPLDRELDAIQPRFAVILVGTHELEDGDFDAYGSRLFELTDRLIARGVIPALTSLMPRDDSAEAKAEVPRFNAVMRGVAQARQVPFVDLHREVESLPDHGLGPNGVLPSVYRDPEDVARPCAFHEAGLGHGYNVRNLITLEALQRLVRVVVDGQAAPDAPARQIEGTGTHEDPIVIAQLPFSHAADTRSAGERRVERYDGCAASQNEAGAELIYRLTLDRPTRIRAMIVDRGAADLDVHLLQGGTAGEHCIERAHRLLATELEPGTYHFSIDTFVSQGMEQSGEYLFVLTED